MPMQPQFSTTSLVSFHLFLDNWITQRGRAYTNVTTPLFYQPDPQLQGYVAYASPFRSWVCDSGISGAVICSSVSGSLGVGGTGEIARGQSGMMIDYVNGRVLFPASVGTNAKLTGTYAFPDLNVYKANETQEQIVFTQKYYLNSRFGNPMTGIPTPGTYVTPAIFVSDAGGQNEPWAFGGTYKTDKRLSLVVLAENMTQLEGALSLIEDMKDVSFPQLPLSAWPLGPLGDYKSGYNYETYKGQYGSSLFSITEARTSKLGDGVKIDQALFVGLADVTVSTARSIH